MKWFAIIAYVFGIGFIIAFIVVWLVTRSLPGWRSLVRNRFLPFRVEMDMLEREHGGSR